MDQEASIAAAAGLQRGALVIYASLPLRHGHPALPGLGATAEEQANAYRLSGAGWLHVVDVDAASGEHNQWSRLARLLDGTMRVQFGGGVRSMTQVQQLLDLGVNRVVVGTQAVRNPLWARELALVFPGRIVISLDARGRDLVVAGRTEDAGLDVVDTARTLEGAGLAGLLYTDIDGSPDPEVVRLLRMAAPKTPLVVAGAEGLEDLEWLREAGAAGAVVGPGMDLAEALQRFPAPPAPPILQVLRAREELEEAAQPDADEDEGDPEDGADGP